jgi:DNA-binding SARP family transcriptional activator
MRCVAACGLLWLIGLTSVVQAQGNKKGNDNSKPGTKCEIDLNSPAEMFSAGLYLHKATDAKTDTAEADKNWRAAIGALSAPGYKNPNPTAYAYIVAQALVAMGTRPGAPDSAPRSLYGFKDKPNDILDPLATSDTMLKTLATAKPLCEPVTVSIREQGYIPLYNAGAKALGSNQLDSVKAAATRATTLYPDRPEAYNLLAGVALKQKDPTTAIANYKKVVQAAGTDSGFAKTRQGALFNLGVVLQNQSDAATDPAQKKDLAKQAADAWTQYIQMNPNDADAKTALARSQQAAGDTAAVTQAYTDMEANPSKYTDLQLFQAGFAASRANRDADAEKLFNAGLQINPYFRDALYYVAAGAFNQKKADTLFPLARKLVDIDPNNADNWRLLAGAYQLRANGEASKPLARKADADTTLKYFTKSKNLPIQLRITKFSKDGDKLILGGTLQNSGTTDKSLTIKFQFIDKTGQVLASSDVPVQIPAQGMQNFEASGTAPGIAAFKYAPLE